MNELPRRALHRWAVALVLATFALIVAGALVTSRDAGLAVPDWPLSYGTLNPPRWYTIENVRTEHGHRLIAGCVALLTIVVAWRAHRLEAPPAVRRLALAAVAAVLLQAVLGGLRVLRLSIDLAMVHGWLAQLFLCLSVALAVITSPNWRAPGEQPTSRALGATAAAAALLVVVQLVVGIIIRHGGAELRPLVDHGVFYVHLLGAAAVLAAAVLMRSIADRSSASPYLARRVRLLVVLITVQIGLGIATWIVTEPVAAGRSATALEAWLPTLHVVTGAGVLAMALTVALHALAQTSPASHSWARAVEAS